jgi:hypothetical protein
MRLLGLSRIGFTVLSLSLAVLLAGCLPPSADRNRPNNATSIDPALAFDNPAGGTTGLRTPTWGEPQFPNQPVEEFLTPMQPLIESESVAGQEPSDDAIPLELDLDLTLGTGDVELPDAAEFDSSGGKPAEDEASSGEPDRALDNKRVKTDNFSDLYPDVNLPVQVEGSLQQP